ncbi:hypothetical protein, partial [Planotetraspora phitsanulokensis]
MPSRKPARPPRPKTYQPGDRVQIRRAYGVIGHVVEVIRRSKPAFFGYLIDFGDHQREFLGSDVVDPPRPLLEEYRQWMADDLGAQYIALLSDAKLARLQREWLEVNRKLTERYPQMLPQRLPGVEPVHRVTIRRTTQRDKNVSSNGA